MRAAALQDDLNIRANLDLAAVLEILAPEGAVLAAAAAGSRTPPALPLLGLRIQGAAIDSRAVGGGELFAALPGARTHGARHVAAALAAGASCALVAARDLPLIAGEADGWRVILVDEPLRALGRLAAEHRRRLDPAIVAVTGSYGKTTVKEMVAGVLGTTHVVHRTPGNFNNHLGVPLTLLGLEPEHRIGVVELGMNAAGEIAALARLCGPDLGIVTGVGRAHLGGLGSRAAIIEAKLELADALAPTARLILPAGDAELCAAAARRPVEVWTVGAAADADLRLEALETTAAGFRLVVSGLGLAGFVLELPVAGPALARDALFALAVGLELGVEAAAARAALAGFRPPAHRLQLLERGGAVILDDCYNASPESMAAALEALARRPAVRRLAVLGDMRELGAESRRAHRELGSRAAAVVERLFLTGDEAETVAAAAAAAGLAAAAIVVEPDVRRLGEQLRAALRPGDAVLVKASRALALERVIEALAPADEGAGGGPGGGG